MTLSAQTIIVGISHGTTALLSAALMLLVLWQAPRLRSNQLFAVMMFFLSAHSVLNVFGRFLQPLDIDPTRIYELILTLNMLFGTMLFFFVAEFAQLKGRTVLALKIYDVIISVAGIITINGGWLFMDMYPMPDGGFNAVYGPAFMPLVIAFLIYLVVTIVMLYRSYEARARIMWPALAFILAGFLSLAIRPILPLPLNSVFLAASSLWMAYVVLNHQLFSPLATLNRELAAANAELAAANQLKNQFLANMSHELRTPLNSIIGYSELVLNEMYGPLTDKQQDRLERVVKNGRHLLGLINDILDLSKIEAGRMLLHTTTLDTVEFFDSVLATIEPMASEKALTIVRDYADAPPLQVDETRARQIFVNLLSNAVKFTNHGMITLHIDADPSQNLVHCSVSDTGIGIPLDKQQEIFEEFRQVDQSYTRKFQGSGLGLSITRHLVEMHGGRIWLESEPGVGTTFHLTLPVGSSIPDEHSGLPETIARHPQGTVLVIESDPDALKTICNQLNRQGYRVLCAQNGEQALARARDVQPDLILLDPMMSGMNGWQTLEALSTHPATRQTPALMVGRVNNETMGVPLGVSSVISKPVESAQLLTAVQRALDGHQEGTILVVDDHEPDRLLLQQMLTGAGHRVVMQDNGKQACDWLRYNSASLVILDLMMPEVTGFDVLRHIRSQPALTRLPVLVVTAKDLTPDEEHFLYHRYTALLETGGRIQDILLNEVKESLKAHE
jgi:signal transduction histidine kinase/CheY-like chemotaxis protein